MYAEQLTQRERQEGHRFRDLHIPIEPVMLNQATPTWLDDLHLPDGIRIVVVSTVPVQLCMKAGLHFSRNEQSCSEYG